jgi:hypothetical protein
MAILVQSGDPGRKETPSRLREDLRRRHQRAADADELRAMLSTLGLTPRHAARIFAVGPRTVRRWRDGTRGIPRAVTLVCRLMAVGAVTIAQVEEVTVPAPEPPAPLRATPAPEEQPALALWRARTAARADTGPTTTVVEQVCALTAGACRWPCNNLEDRDFRFCNKPTVKGSYCKHHHRMAYLPPRPGRGHGVGFVAHGRHGRPPIPRAPKILFDRAAPPPA